MQRYDAKGDLNQRCYRLGLAVIKLTDALPKKRSAWVIADQVIRSSTSIGANLVEGKASSSRLEFKKFYETEIANMLASGVLRLKGRKL